MFQSPTLPVGKKISSKSSRLRGPNDASKTSKWENERMRVRERERERVCVCVTERVRKTQTERQTERVRKTQTERQCAHSPT